MQSAYHSLLPTVDGVQQAPGAEYTAQDVGYEADDEAAQLSLDIAHAYPAEAGIQQWKRTVRLDRGEQVIVIDEYAFSKPVDEVVVSVVTPCAVDLSEPGVVGFQARAILDGRVSGSGRLVYDADTFTASTEIIPIGDERMGGAWGQEIYRVVLTAAAPAQQDRWVFTVTP